MCLFLFAQALAACCSVLLSSPPSCGGAVDGYLQWAQSRSNGHATGFSGSAELQNTAVLWCQRLNVSPFSHSPFMYLAV